MVVAGIKDHRPDRQSSFGAESVLQEPLQPSCGNGGTVNGPAQRRKPKGWSRHRKSLGPAKETCLCFRPRLPFSRKSRGALGRTRQTRLRLLALRAQPNQAGSPSLK